MAPEVLRLAVAIRETPDAVAGVLHGYNDPPTAPFRETAVTGEIDDPSECSAGPAEREVIDMEILKSTNRFDEIVWPHMATVLRTAQCLSRDDAAAEDLAQDTMIKAFKSLDALRDDACVKAWLLTILRRAHIDQARSAEVPMQSLDGMKFDPEAPEVEDLRGWKTDKVSLDKRDQLLENFSDHQTIVALKELPKEIRWTLLLMDVEGLDQREAAQVLEIPVGTVKSRMHRGRAMLHLALRPAVRAAAPDTQGAQVEDLQPRVHQQHRRVRHDDNFLDEAIPAVAVGVGEPVK